MAELTPARTKRVESEADAKYGSTGPRRLLHDFLSNRYWEFSLNVIVVTNIVIIYLEVNDGMKCKMAGSDDDSDCVPRWYFVTNLILLVFYTVEMFLNMFVQRMEWLSRKNVFNYVDATIVFIGYLELVFTWLEVAGGNVMALTRMLKVLRVLRVVRLLKPFPELYMLIAGFISTMRTMAWGFLMIVVLLIIWGIVTVQVLTATELPGNFTDPWCNDAFSEVHMTSFWLFQTLIAGDSWGYCVIPIVQYNFNLFWLFGTILITLELGFMNLILAVIVDGSAQTREMRAEEKIAAKKKERETAIAQIADILKDLDEDGSGQISLEELTIGYEENNALRQRFDELGIAKKDLGRLIEVMDEDQSGEVDYEEFSNGLLSFEETDPRAQNLALNLMIREMQLTLTKRFSVIEQMLESGVTSGEKEKEKESSPSALGPFSNGVPHKVEVEYDPADLKPTVAWTMENGVAQHLFQPLHQPTLSQAEGAVPGYEAISNLHSIAKETMRSAQRLMEQSSLIKGNAMGASESLDGRSWSKFSQQSADSYKGIKANGHFSASTGFRQKGFGRVAGRPTVKPLHVALAVPKHRSKGSDGTVVQEIDTDPPGPLPGRRREFLHEAAGNMMQTL
eukprot:TRINITY_DN40191_c0_g1_i1.p1 TRINITY_DN40191_c0_g1~~TRINITY_DN40191_c0_g1_i1.p1  ORF type:complete len:621 (+),score=109.00 TRINITY_DN40191_c0_g1_i1:61-1923(+)